jgi:hypothetical protein
MEARWIGFAANSGLRTKLIKDVGFDIVLEQYDPFPNILRGMDHYYRGEDRALFVGIKSL